MESNFDEIKVGDKIVISGVRKKWARDKSDLVFTVKQKVESRRKKK